MSTATGTMLQIKGRMITVTVLRLLTATSEAVAAALDEHFRDAPELLSGLPTVVDLEPLGEAPAGPDLKTLQDLLRARGVTLIGLRDSGETVRRMASAAGIPVIKLDGGREAARRGSESAARTPPQVPTGSSPTLVVAQPVRSGQQIYARGGDLVLTTAVSAGAEVLADGHIHAYGPLRGRAMAGVVGDVSARIFCRRLDCEMVAIAGRYRLSEQITDREREGPVQVRLEGDSLLIEPL